METDEVLMALKTSRTGLGEGEAERRLREFGSNLLEERKKTSALDILFSQFRDIFVFILLVGIIISIITAFLKYEAPVLEDYVEAITIGAIVVLNVGVGFVQEYRSERAMEALRQFTVPRAGVLRDEEEKVIHAEKIVSGDIIVLEAGDRVPADGRLILSIDLRTDEAILTGESTPVEKLTGKTRADISVAEQKNMVFMGTHIAYGRARGKCVVRRHQRP